jgi:putative ABC transport system permease protein
MGYPNSYLASVVVNQATFLAVLGYITGWILSVGLFWVTSSLAKIPIQMDPLTMVVVFIVTLLMCVFSGLLALRKAYAAEPADLF